MAPRIVLGVGWVWIGFALVHLIQGHPVHVLITGSGGLACLALGVLGLVGRISDRAVIHGLMGVSMVALTGSGLYSGQAASDAAWWLAMIPVGAALFLGGAGGLLWGAIAVLGLGLLHLSPSWVQLEPEFLATGPDLMLRQVATVMMLTVTGWLLHGSWSQRSMELRRARDAAADEARARSRFLASISHELRTPLNGVLGMTQVLETTALRPEQGEMVRTMRASGELLLGQVNEILDFAKIDARGVDLSPRQVHLRPIVEDVTRILAATAWERGLEISWIVDDDVPEVAYLDGERLRQVLVNLVGNGLKFTAIGGVWLRVALCGEDRLRIEVGDTGPGVSAADVDRMFHPFQQLDHTSTPGTGLGLAFCHEVVCAMGGLIEVDSEPGRGALFFFEIDAPAIEVPRKRSLLSGRSVRLIGSDSRTTESVRMQLRYLGMEEVQGEGAQLTVCVGSAPGPAKALRVHRVRPADPGLGLVGPVRTEELEMAIRRMLHGRPSLVPHSMDADPGLEVATVLVVDDDATNRTVVKLMLQGFGLEPVLVEDGVQAVAALREHDFDLVLMDMWMPQMDGIEATRTVREFRPGQRVVAMSASVLQEDRARWALQGVHEYLDKPVDRELLERLLRGLTPSGSTRAVSAGREQPLG